jgi:hypothetical protein
MAVVRSGSGRTGDTTLGNFGDLPIEQVLCAFPGTDWDKPLPSVKAFDSLEDTATQADCRWLNQWIAPQTTCQYVLDHHGSVGLSSVLRGIARACSKHKITMSRRVRSAAIEQGLPVY